MAKTNSDVVSILQDILSVENEEGASELFLKLNHTSHQDIVKILSGEVNITLGTNETDKNIQMVKVTHLILEYTAAVENNEIHSHTQEILWLCIHNCKHYYTYSVISLYYHNNLKNWIGEILLTPENCSDSYLRIELITFKYLFGFHYTRYFWEKMEVSFIITLKQIDVDKYLSFFDDTMLNSSILINFLERLSYADAFSGVAFMQAGNKLKMKMADLQREFYTKIIDLLAKMILLDVKRECCMDVNGIMLVVNSIVKFFDLYFELKHDILDYHQKSHPLVTATSQSVLAIITDCILLIQAKLVSSGVDSSFWSVMICGIEKLQDQMAIMLKQNSPDKALQRFLIERSFGNVNINYNKKLYNVTTGIKQINVSERIDDEIDVNHIKTLEWAFRDLTLHINSLSGEYHNIIQLLHSDDESNASDDESNASDDESNASNEESNASDDESNEPDEDENLETGDNMMFNRFVEWFNNFNCALYFLVRACICIDKSSQ